MVDPNTVLIQVSDLTPGELELASCLAKGASRVKIRLVTKQSAYLAPVLRSFLVDSDSSVLELGFDGIAFKVLGLDPSKGVIGLTEILMAVLDKERVHKCEYGQVSFIL